MDDFQCLSCVECVHHVITIPYTILEINRHLGVQLVQYISSICHIDLKKPYR